MNTIISILVPVFIVIGFIIIFQTFLKRSDRISRLNKESFLEDEQKASFSRVHTIESSRYIIPNIDNFPIMKENEINNSEDEYAYTMQQIALTKATKVMGHFEETNLELKKMYGASNLESIIQSEENYNDFFQSLQAWAKALTEADRKSDAIKVLEEGLSVGLDFTNSFLLLANLYKESGNKEALIKLLELTKENKNITIGKVTTYIENIITK